MIVRMNKVTLLCTERSRDRTLDALRKLGVVHLAHVTLPAGGDLDKARERLDHVRRALELLPKHPGTKSSGTGAEQVVEETWRLIQASKEQQQKLDALVYEQQRLEPFGSFDPSSIARLGAAGITVKLYHCARGQPRELPEGATELVLREDKTGCYFAVLARGPVELACTEFRLPEKSLRDITEQLAATRQALADNEMAMAQFAGDREAVSKLARECEESVEYLEARRGMSASGPVAYLRGFCPAETVEAVRAEAASRGWGLIVDDPSADDQAPTLIRNPRWVKPIKAVLDFIGVLPGYEEIDISAVFLLFLSLFFAMLVGDAGYGLLFIALTFWGRRKFPKAPAYPFHLMYVMSICTVFWGALTGSWFGSSRLPAVLDGLSVAWLKDPNNVMLLCFAIGAVHLTIAHLWNIMRGWNSPKALAQLGWIGSTWTMFFMARNLVLGHALPGWIGGLFIASVVLIILFMTAPRDFKNEWFNHVMLPLNLVSNFVDVVSYIRLFAVGTAGFAVASSFNTMILGGGVHGVVAGLIAALLLFLGHALNILLSVMGVLVHGVRLNTLEFSSHIGMQWTGIPFKPFARLDPKEKNQ